MEILTGGRNLLARPNEQETVEVSQTGIGEKRG